VIIPALAAAWLASVNSSPGAKAGRPGVPGFLSAPAQASGRKLVLGLFAHYDDDSVIAGTLNRLVRDGWEVHLAWITASGLGGVWGQSFTLHLTSLSTLSRLMCKVALTPMILGNDPPG